MVVARDRLDRDGAGPDDLARQELREAYERGRSDERKSRKRHPVAMTLMFAAAVVGVVLLALAAVNGSFTRAGATVDQNLNTAVTTAEPQVRGAAAQAGESLREAGQSVREKATDGPG
jgi:predicted anti-sigma-YlaC factor YlaD